MFGYGRAKSLRELQDQDRVRPVEVIKSIADYAETGAPIDADVVESILMRVQMTRTDLQQCLALLEEGVRAQVRRGQTKETTIKEMEEYTLVANYIRGQLGDAEPLRL